MSEKQLHVFYEDASDESTIREYIESIDRLGELIEVQKMDAVHPGLSNALYVSENRIHIRPDWLDTRPAIVFPSEIPFNKNYFLGTVFGLLGNEEKYPQYLYVSPAMLYIFDLIQSIISGEEADSALEKILSRTKFANPFENYAFNHNVAIALNYGNFSSEINPDAIKAHYTDALELAFEPSFRAYTLKYYATFLMDTGDSAGAIRVLQQQTFKNLDDYPKYALEKVWCQAALKQLSFPCDADEMSELKSRLWQTLQFFDGNGHKIIAAFLYMDAATIAGYDNSYAESLGYITKAINYFKDNSQLEMLAQAQMLRGRLFYDWAQSGNPQFYRSALEAYMEALKVFKKDEAHEVFADIHHQLGVIYAELPDENKKRSIWAALSVTSFTEALEYYNKVDQPYQYGMICNNYANAYAKYPPGGRTDNYEKALWFYEEALSVRPALQYPTERAVTLLNYLDASWKAGNPGDDFNTARYNGMVARANEIKTLTGDEQLIAEADKHIALLEELGKELVMGDK
jgi:tetratricopeptide (TPR) repeat protein